MKQHIVENIKLASSLRCSEFFLCFLYFEKTQKIFYAAERFVVVVVVVDVVVVVAAVAAAAVVVDTNTGVTFCQFLLPFCNSSSKNVSCFFLQAIFLLFRFCLCGLGKKPVCAYGIMAAAAAY